MNSGTVIFTWLAVLVLTLCGSVGSAADRQHIIVVIGAGGTPEYGKMFSEWADRWETAAGIGGASCVIIGHDENSEDLQQLQQAFSEAATVRTSEPLWLVLLGHGTFDGRVTRFNLRGPDLSAEAAAEMLSTSRRPIAVVNCSSCSAPFINALSGPQRTIISATKDGNEIQFSRFGGYMADAVGGLEADIDRDGQTSLLEAWLFAARRTAEYYESDGRLATEHSLLDDSGDGKGTRSDVFAGVRIRDSVKDKSQLDGGLAKRWHLIRSESEKRLSPEQRLQRDELENQLEQLRTRKKEFTEVRYLDELENILVPLARIYAAAEVDRP